MCNTWHHGAPVAVSTFPIYAARVANAGQRRYSLSRSRRQLDGLWPKACLKSLDKCAWSENPTLRAMLLSEAVPVSIR